MAMKVYTKTGDKGTTGLIGGARVPKDDIRIEAYGTVDELNSQIGFMNDLLGDEEIKEWVAEIQDRLFTIGSELATDPNKDIKMKLPDLIPEDITWLEQKIDYMDNLLPPMKFFVLPGGHQAASAAHIARCVCRRAERICVHMQHIDEYVHQDILIYLNRLSDFLFVLSRYILHKNGCQEVPWRARLKKD